MEMKNMEIDIFDIDGTVTNEGCDLWYECSEKLVQSTDDFQAAISTWREKKGADPVGASLWMMNEAVNLMPQSTTGEDVAALAADLSKEYLIQGKVRKQALEKVNKSLQNDRLVVFSSTNFFEGARAFIDAVIESELINGKYPDRIFVSGTKINWQKKKVTHFNMSEGKVRAMEQLLGVNSDELKKRAHMAFGDDPTGNDKGILELASRPFVINTKKNIELELPKNFERLNW